MPKSDKEIDLTIVVSGQPHAERVNDNQPVHALVEHALKDSGNQGQPAADWELRKVDGTLIDQNSTALQAGLADGMTLFLTPRAGAGG
jgi:Protein of Unknown function (DUF2604)